MKNRKAFNISTIIQCYNIFQVVACTYFVIKFHDLGFSFRNTWKCARKLEVGREDETFTVLWWFIMLRTVELVETVFFILRKKENQVSALHLYHHISTIVLLWLYLKHSAGELFSLSSIVSINFLFHFIRNDGNFYRGHQLLCTHNHVHVLLLQLRQKSFSFCQGYKTFSDFDSTHPIIHDSCTLLCCRLKILWCIKIILSPGNQHFVPNFPFCEIFRQFLHEL